MAARRSSEHPPLPETPPEIGFVDRVGWWVGYTSNGIKVSVSAGLMKALDAQHPNGPHWTLSYWVSRYWDMPSSSSSANMTVTRKHLTKTREQVTVYFGQPVYRGYSALLYGSEGTLCLSRVTPAEHARMLAFLGMFRDLATHVADTMRDEFGATVTLNGVTLPTSDQLAPDPEPPTILRATSRETSSSEIEREIKRESDETGGAS